MPKTKSVWCCVECGQQHIRWAGQCSQCKSWNSLHEEIQAPSHPKITSSKNPNNSRPLALTDVTIKPVPRISTHIGEFDRLLGGGLVPGSFTLIGGDPGIGKSTLMLQMAEKIAKQKVCVLYVCGEESIEQASLRAKRLNLDSENLLLVNETNLEVIQQHIKNVDAKVVIIDSVQVVYKPELSSAPGSVSQVRDVAAELMHLAKGSNISIFLVGHVTKSGEIAGPRVLEHLVDTVLYFEGDKHQNYRITRVVKNRFGPTDEIAVFQMMGNGLVEVPNPSEVFLEERTRGVVGSVIVPAIEGTRPFLVEVQALVTDTSFSTPTRKCAGLDQTRLTLLLAVLEKRLNYQLYNCDVFVSVAGGLKIVEPAIDLGVIASVASSLCNRIIDPDTVVLGEVGLGGEIRSIPRLETRIKESIQMGFKNCLIPKRNYKSIPEEMKNQIQVHGIEFVEDAINALLQ